jgi:peptidyl-prolyl cis-trans isomerase SurA
MLSSGLPDTPDIRQRLLPQLLRALIDEQLELQEAKRLDITVSKDDIDQALQRIAHDNNIQGDMQTYVTSHGGSADALTQQVRATLSWSKVVQRELRPRVDVGDDEVDAVIERMRANVGKEEYMVSEIMLAVDSPKDEDQVRQFADNLVQQIKGGANFGAVARQFSQGTGAAAGGDIGWIQEGQLAPELNHALADAHEGEIIGPVRTSSGYHILGIRQKRTISLGNSSDITLKLQQVFRPYAAGETADSIQAETNNLRSGLTDCAGLQSRVAERFPAWHWQDLGQVELAKAPPIIADKIRDVSSGKTSEPIATDKGTLILFVCDRHVPDENINREAIVNSIGTEKLELQARRLLRDLRRAAYLDVRLASSQ